MTRSTGGAHTSRTMLLGDLAAVLASCPPGTSQDAYRSAVIEENVAGKDSLSSRQRTFRYLREMYILDPQDGVFRALLRLWQVASTARPQVALVLAAARDKALAATSSAVFSEEQGATVTSHDLADAVERTYPGAYSQAIRDKIGRNALSSWTQSGYLVRKARGPAVRAKSEAEPAAVAMALVLGSARGLGGELLFTTPEARVLQSSLATMHDRAHEASRKGWIEYRSRGQVTEVDVSALTAPLDDHRVPLEGVTL